MKIFFISLAILSFFLKDDPAPNYKIEGTLHGVKTDWIYIAHFDSLKKIAKLDSAQVINEKYTFTGTVGQPEYCYLGMRHVNKQGKRQGLMLQGDFILDKGTLKLICHKDSIDKLKGTGTPGQNEFKAFKDKVTPIYQVSNKLYGKLLGAKDKALIGSLKKEQASNTLKIKNLIVDQVKTYPNSIVSGIIVKENIHSLDVESLNTIYALFSSDVKNSNYGNFAYRKMIAEQRTELGMIAPTFQLPDQVGKMVSLSDYKGKVTLVDFWASWCGPCRAENPNLIKAYQEYKGKGFEILGVSMDGDKTAWINAIKEDRLPWTQVSDLKATKSEMKILYGITAIPMNFLLNKDGKIIGRNLKGAEVQQALAKHIN